MAASKWRLPCPQTNIGGARYHLFIGQIPCATPGTGPNRPKFSINEPLGTTPGLGYVHKFPPAAIKSPARFDALCGLLDSFIVVGDPP